MRHPRVENQPKHLLQTVVRVDHGRGFIVNAINRRRFVVTAAHCLERTRLATQHLTFTDCLGMLDAKQLSISAELVFFSLIDDLAVLAAPHSEQAKAFSGLTNESALSVALPPIKMPSYTSRAGSHGWILSFENEWMPCRVRNSGRLLRIDDVKFYSGMAGSPILNQAGAAIGAVSGHSDHPAVCLSLCLPPWLWRELQVFRPTKDDVAA